MTTVDEAREALLDRLTGRYAARYGYERGTMLWSLMRLHISVQRVWHVLRNDAVYPLLRRLAR